ncbi:hypothetical protein FRB94_003848 [Tulasnella sp. JGI-2019a]|nr:hypothetical protein FRB94_003848 [Tulasnella sp. JGI-2019a]KAG9003699.1 hypothetical protein FRB93_010920 [Tulasnella sp. JGI-2019a]
MTFHPFEVSAAHLAYAVLGGFVVFFGMFSLVIKEKLYIGEAPLATAFGIIIGPYAIGLFDPRGWGKNGNDINDATSNPISNEITLEVTRVVLAIGVFAIGAELPKQYMKKHWRSLAFLLGPVMVAGWFVSAGFIYALIPKISWLSALVIAACLTPTDPILAAAVVGGKYANKHVPAHLRHLLAAESGCNDGAAFPFLYIALYLTLNSSPGHAVGEWFYSTWLYEILLGIVFGSLLGYGFRHLMKFSERKALIDRTSYVAQYISLALLAIGATTLLGSDDLLAAFCCGTAFAWDGWFNRQTEESQFSNVIDLLFNCACFIYIGAWIPFKDFNQIANFSITPWRLVVLSILILIFRRLPAIVALYKWIPDIKNLREAVFSGHFGPMGVGAVFISTYAGTMLPEATDDPQNQLELLASTIQPVVAFMVLSSIVIHGLSIPFFSLGRRVHSITYTYTYSRRQSMDPNNGGQPDWITQVRRLPSKHAHDEVVIEKDENEKPIGHTPTSDEDRLERGESESGSRTAAGGSRNSPVQTGKYGEEGGGEGGGVDGEHLTDTDLGEGEHEWREGRDLVVEHQARGCDDVEVQVFKNVFVDDKGNVTGGMQEKVRKEIEAYRTGGAKGALVEVKRQVSPSRAAQGLTSSPSSPGQEEPKTLGIAAAADEEAIDPDTPEAGPSRWASVSRSQSHEQQAAADEWRDEPSDDENVISHPERPVDDLNDAPPTPRSGTPPRHRIRHGAHVFSPPIRIPGRRRDSVRRSLFSGSKHSNHKTPSRHEHHTPPGAEGVEGEGSSPLSRRSSATASPASTSNLELVPVSPTSPTTPVNEIAAAAGGGERRRGRASDIRGDHSGVAMPSSRRSSMRPAHSRANSPAGRIRFADEASRPGTPVTTTKELGSPTSPGGSIIKSASSSRLQREMMPSGNSSPSSPVMPEEHMPGTFPAAEPSSRVMFDLSGSSRPGRS